MYVHVYTLSTLLQWFEEGHIDDMVSPVFCIMLLLLCKLLQSKLIQIFEFMRMYVHTHEL